MYINTFPASTRRYATMLYKRYSDVVCWLGFRGVIYILSGFHFIMLQEKPYEVIPVYFYTIWM